MSLHAQDGQHLDALALGSVRLGALAARTMAATRAASMAKTSTQGKRRRSRLCCGVYVSYPLRPLKEMPSMNCFWAKKKTSTMGNMATREAAMR